MKRLFSFVLVFAIAVSLFLSVSADSKYADLDSMSLSELKQLEQAVQSKISEKEKAAKHPIPDDSYSTWTVKYYVDEFGDETDDWYITNKKDIIGTFSNSAVTNAKCRFSFLIDFTKTGDGTLSVEIRLKIYEYGDSLVKNYRNTKMEYDVTVRKADGSKSRGHADMATDPGDRVRFYNESSQAIADALWCDESVSIYFNEKGRPINSYKLNIDSPKGICKLALSMIDQK